MKRKEEEEKDALENLVRLSLDDGKIDSEIFCAARKLGYDNENILRMIVKARKTISTKRWYRRAAVEEETEENYDGLSPLLYAISICDEELSLKRIEKSSANDTMEYGLTALHVASERGMLRVVRQLLSVGARIDQQTLSDVRLHHTVVQSGGLTALHFATQKGHRNVVKVLLDNGANATIRDFDENTPLEIAMLRDDMEMTQALLKYLKIAPPKELEDPVSLNKWRDLKRMRDREARTKRSRDAFVPLPSLQNPYKLKSVYSHKECERILRDVKRHTSEHGWTSQRHRGHASTTDIQCSEIETLNTYVRQTLRKRLFPELARRHEFELSSFSFRDLFFVKYSASEKDGSSGQRGVGIHRDGSIVSFNVLLNSSDEFTGGGTYIEATDTVHTINRGDCFVHSGKVRHGGETITSGMRFILVGFLDAKLRADASQTKGDVSVELHTRSGRYK
jgi:ankyrin repeat protein